MPRPLSHYIARVLQPAHSELPWNALAGYRRNWVREFGALASVRFVAVCASTALVTLLAALHPFPAASRVIALHLAWLVVTGITRVLVPRVRTPSRAACVGVAAWLSDILLMGSIMAMSGPVWWFGLLYLTMVSSMGLITMPGRARLWVLGAAWLACALLVQAHMADLLPRSGWLDGLDMPGWVGPLIPLVSGGLPLMAFAWQQQQMIERLLGGVADYRRVVAHAPDPIWMMTPNGLMLAMNGSAEQLTGRTFAEWRGRSMLECVLADDRADVEAAMRLLDAQPYGVTFRCSGVHSAPVHLDASLVRMHDDDGAPVILGIGRDVTAMHEAAATRDALAQAEDRATTLQRTARIVGGLAHELNNPLAAIATTLEAPHESPNAAKEREQLLARARDAQRVLHDLLLVTSPPRRSDAWQPVQLDRLLDTRWTALSAQADEAHVLLSRTTVGRLAPVLGDASLLARALDHLVRNAIEASPPGAEVRVSLTGDAAGVTVDVEDGGRGLPARVRDALFEPFISTKGPHGVGLGLSFAHAVVTRADGRLELLDVRTGHGGTLARAWLPATPLPETALASLRDAITADPALDTTMPHVLIVDDEKAIGTALSRFFARRGWSVTVCNDGLAAERLLLSDDAPMVDAIVCDVRLPGLSGPDLMQRVRRHAPHVAARFVFITGDTSSPETAEALSALDAPVLLKPFQLDQLFRTVDGVRATSG